MKTFGLLCLCLGFFVLGFTVRDYIGAVMAVVCPLEHAKPPALAASRDPIPGIEIPIILRDEPALETEGVPDLRPPVTSRVDAIPLP